MVMKTLFRQSIIEGLKVGRRTVVDGLFILAFAPLQDDVTDINAEADHGEKAHHNRPEASLDRSDVNRLHPEPNKIQNGEKQ